MMYSFIKYKTSHCTFAGWISWPVQSRKNGHSDRNGSVICHSEQIPFLFDGDHGTESQQKYMDTICEDNKSKPQLLCHNQFPILF